MKRRFHLVQDGLSKDTVHALESMLQAARRGELIGLAYVAMFRRREYAVSATDEALRNPTFTRGMVCALDDFLSELIAS